MTSYMLQNSPPYGAKHTFADSEYTRYQISVTKTCQNSKAPTNEMCAKKIQNISEMSNSKEDGGGGKSRPKNKRQIRATTD